MIKIANISKRFAAWVINFKRNPFLKARLKLTVYYTIGVSIILLIFSLAVYGLFAKNISSNLEYAGSDQEEDANVELQIIDKAQEQLQTILFTVDGLVIILIIIFSYYLSGKSLKPIEIFYERQKKFVADTAHELRTPLTVMKTGAEAILSGDNGKEEYKKLTQDSLEEINFLSSMVDDLLFLARSDDFKKVEFSKFDLGKLAHKQIELMKPYASKKNITLRNNIKGEFQIDGNKVYLKRLLVNLIKNAIDYNKPQGEASVSLQKKKQQVELKIADTGIGISKNDLEHIFDRFYKADQARVKQSGGAGLGLSIAQEIIALHQGKIDIKSELGKGTEIVVSLPLISS
jgi:signal transduction histidine kinase